MAIIKIISATCMLAMAGSVAFKAPVVTKKIIKSEAQQVLFQSLGHQISSARERMFFEEETFAQALGISDKQLRGIEEGKIIPTKDLVFKIEEILKTTFTM